MKKFYLIITGFILLGISSNAQLEFLYDEQDQNIFSEQLTDAFNVNIDSLMLDSIIIAFKNSLPIPGIATLIIKENEVVWNKNYGYRNLEFQLPVEDSTLFFMASISKTIIATAVMQLWENGLLELDNNINDYLPSGLTVVNPYFSGSVITVKMLMNHTSSIQDNWNFMDYLFGCGDYPVPYDSFLVNYFTPGGSYYSLNNFYNYAPGQNWHYTNAGTCLLALMVEHLSGKSFNEYTRDSIFIPLSMNKTSWFLAGLDTTKIATPYMGQPPIALCHNGLIYWPIAQLRTNKFELSNFLSAYVNGGIFNNNRILNSSTVEMMLTDQSGFINIHGITGAIQGLIWFTDPNIYNTVWGHGGAWYGVATWMFFNPLEKWGIISITNWNQPPWLPDGSNSPMAQYAHLYGNIYALHPSVDKSYAKVNVDSVLFRTRFSNIYNHQFIPHLIYVNLDSTLIDSLTLYDDGLHGDSLSNDGIFGNYIPPRSLEDYFTVSVSTVDNQTNKYFNTPDIDRFTTVGPVVLDSISCTKLSTYYLVKTFLRNESTSLTITNASVKLICDDSWALPISPDIKNLPDIPPGGVVSNPSAFLVRQIDSLFPGYFNFKVEVKSDLWTYWKDSLQVIVTGVGENPISLPSSYILSQNFPNPFNPRTVISYQLPIGGNVTLKVFDILGNEMAILVNEYRPAGKYEMQFNAASLPSGVYFYRLKAGDFISTKKMILMK